MNNNITTIEHPKMKPPTKKWHFFYDH